jgi:hypothetical protein
LVDVTWLAAKFDRQGVIPTIQLDWRDQIGSRGRDALIVS